MFDNILKNTLENFKKYFKTSIDSDFRKRF